MPAWVGARTCTRAVSYTHLNVLLYNKNTILESEIDTLQSINSLLANKITDYNIKF